MAKQKELKYLAPRILLKMYLKEVDDIIKFERQQVIRGIEMRKGDVIELRTIDKKGFISFQHLKIKDARQAKRLLRINGYSPMAEPNTYFCSHQYD